MGCVAPGRARFARCVDRALAQAHLDVGRRRPGIRAVHAALLDRTRRPASRYKPRMTPTTTAIAPGIHRISIPVPLEGIPGGFTFNQFLVAGGQPLLFHTGPRKLFPAVLAAVRSILDPATLRYIGFSHFEADECGSLNEWLAVAPLAQPLCSNLGAMVSVNDVADRPARGLADGECLDLGEHVLRWIDAPHVPHGMDCGYLFEERTRTLLCGDLFTQPGADLPAITEDDIFGASEAMREGFPYAPVSHASSILNRMAALEPRVLACMHGSTFHGDGGALLRQLARALQ